jgi:hypothetical protein
MTMFAKNCVFQFFSKLAQKYFTLLNFEMLRRYLLKVETRILHLIEVFL